MLKPHRYTFLLSVICGDAASQSDSGGNSHVSMFVDSYILMGEAFAGNCGIWPGILPVGTLFRIGIGVVIFVSDREKCCLLCDLAFYVFQIYMEG